MPYLDQYKVNDYSTREYKRLDSKKQKCLDETNNWKDEVTELKKQYSKQKDQLDGTEKGLDNIKCKGHHAIIDSTLTYAPMLR